MFDSNGDTPLTLAVRMRQEKAAIVLLQRTGISPLFCVEYARNGHWEHALLMAVKVGLKAAAAVLVLRLEELAEQQDSQRGMHEC
jgi:ankyrin repeat protein